MNTTEYQDRVNKDIDSIIAAVNEVCGVDIRERVRKRRYFHGRQIYSKIARSFYGLSLMQIGESLGITHSSVINMMNKFKADIFIGVNKNLYDDALTLLGFEPDNITTMIEDKRNEIEKSMLKDIISGLMTLSGSELYEFHETRLKPFLKMIKNK